MVTYTVLQRHTYEDFNYNFEITLETDYYAPSDVAEIIEKAARDWYDDTESADWVMAEYIQNALVEAGCTIVEWDDLTDYDVY